MSFFITKRADFPGTFLNFNPCEDEIFKPEKYNL